MLSVTLLFNLVFVPILIENCASITPKQIRLIEKNTEIRYFSDISNTVRIRDEGKTSECNIYAVNNINDAFEAFDAKNKLYAFNVFLNCKFANWTANKIYDLFKLSPMFYRHEFQSFEYYRNEYKDPFERYVEKLKSDFDENVENFIRVLNALEDVAPDASYYTDARILKTLLSLKTKIHSIPTIRKNLYGETDHPDYKIIRLLLIDMIDLQTFMTMNCPQAPAIKKQPELYGYWIALDHPPLTVEDIAFVMNVIDKKLAFESDGDRRFRGDPPRPFDGTTLSPTEDGAIVRHIVDSVLVNLPRAESVPLTAFWKRMQTHYAIDLIVEYQDLVYVSVLKLIDARLTTNGRNRNAEVETTKRLQRTHLNVTRLREDLPEYLVVGFDVLSKSGNNSGVNEDRFLEILKRVTLLNPCPSVETADLFDLVDERMDDIVRFNRLYGPVRRERAKLYLPLVRNRLALLPDDENDAFADGCVFVEIIYALCYQAIVHLTRFINIFGKGDHEPFRSSFVNACIDMYHYSLAMFEKRPNVVVHKIALDVAAIVLNMFRLDDNERTKLSPPDLHRYFKVIMNVMDGYEIVYCTGRRSNFLLFNNVNFGDFGNKHLSDVTMAKLSGKNESDFLHARFVSSRKIGEQFLHVEVLNRSYVKGNGLIERFKEKIKVNWKGSVQNLTDIFDREGCLVLNPRSVYALYDAFFMYCTAIIFDHLRNVVSENKKISIISPHFEYISKMLIPERRWLDLFPQQVKYFVEDIEKLLHDTSISSMRVSSLAIADIKKTIKNISNRFETFGIVFIEKKTILFISVSVEME